MTTSRILIVDDKEENQYLMRVLLQGHGYAVDEAHHGAEALELARQNPPDLVIADILMPVMDGFALCREWKKDERLKRIPFVFYTATYTDERDRKLALSLGAERFIIKPEEPDAFMEIIRETVQQAGSPSTGQAEPEEEESIYLKQYNEALIRKLEAKMEQLERANRALERDITERVEAERRRARAEERLAQERYLVDTLMENTPDNIYFKDAEGRFIRINRALARYFRLDDPAQAVGKTDADFFGPEHAQQALADEQQILRGGEALVGKEEKETWPDGHVTYVSTTKAPLYDRAGAIVGTCGISRDITAHVDAERRQARMEEQLRQAQKMEALGQLAGGVAHDFNNLLTVIQGNAQFALESLPMGCAERDEIGDVLKAAKSAGDLTRQLLAFSRRQVVEMRVLDLNGLLGGMGRMLGRILGESVRLEMDLAGSLPPIKADPGQIEQVVVNLCVNARDAMPGGGTLTLATTEVDLDQALVDARPGLRAGRHVALTVSDTGCGMSPEVQARLFEPFFTTKGPGKGTGLGLATVHGIVQQSGGTIEASSRLGQGSTFRIYLPCAGKVAATAGEAEAEAPRGSETVLVVDDDPVVQRMTARMLGDLGYRVLQAPHVADVLALCRMTTDPIHLLLTDVRMPGMNGPELLAQLRALRPETRVLYMTGYTDDSITHLGVLAEGEPLIQKPFTLQSLARKVRAALDARGAG